MTNQADAAADEQFVVVDKDVDSNKDSTPATEEEPPSTNDNNNSNNNATNPMEIIPPEIILKGLTILSPRQRKKTQETAAIVVSLPPLRPEEPVASIRSAIAEVIGFAHLTKYRLVLERTTSTTTIATGTTNSNGGNKKSNKNNGAANKKNSNGNRNSNGEQKKEWEADNVVSTYTLDGAVMATDRLIKTLKLGRAPEEGAGGNNDTTTLSSEEEEIEFDDYGDLSRLLDVLEKEEDSVGESIDNKIIMDASNFAFRVVLERYDTASIRDHMVRARQLLAGNAPHLTTLVGDLEEEKDLSVVEKKQQIAKKDESDNGGDKDEAKDKVSVFSLFSFSAILVQQHHPNDDNAFMEMITPC